MVRTYLTRGLLVGLLAALFAFGFAKVFGEPQIGKAERFEYSLAQQRGEPIEPAIVSRGTQSTIGLATGLAVSGAAIGGLFALVFAGVHRRVTRARARAVAAVLAGGGFIAVFLAPFFKYPANPPSVGNADTIGHRTELYFLLMAFSVVSLVIAAVVQRRLTPRFGGWNATLLASAVFIGLVALAYLLLPGVNEVPLGFPATVLWNFRLASVGTQVVLWGTLGLAFGALTERQEEAATRLEMMTPAGVGFAG
jgi:predicted cobalt transporter CbtA